MARAPQKLFVERSTYRRRRLMDAVKLIVILGMCLWIMPVLWPTGDVTGRDTVSMSNALYYVFGVWVALIALSGLIVGKLRNVANDPDDSEDGS
ncbi:MAG: hypothetical protein AB8B47_08620 [Roseobacter sp.]